MSGPFEAPKEYRYPAASVIKSQGMCMDPECQQRWWQQTQAADEYFVSSSGRELAPLNLMFTECTNPQEHLTPQGWSIPTKSQAQTCTQHPDCYGAAAALAARYDLQLPLPEEQVVCRHAVPGDPAPEEDCSPERIATLLENFSGSTVPNLVRLFQEGIKEGSIKPAPNYVADATANKS